MNRKRISEMILCALLVLSVLEIKTVYASSPTEWTQNSTFIRSGYQWDTILYDWEWSMGSYPLPDGSDTHEVFENTVVNHAQWLQDGVVDLAASDLDPDVIAETHYGRSARVTYGPFLDPYSDVPPLELSVASTETLTLKGVVSDYGSVILVLGDWTGIKFDAWFEDPLDSGRKMVIEMYFHGAGAQDWWGNEFYRTLGADIDDLLIKLQAFPEYCTIIGDVPSLVFGSLGAFLWSHTEFTIDLKSIWQRAADHFGRSSSDMLYAVALDVESGFGFPFSDVPCATFAEVNEIRVTSRSAPDIPSIPSGVSSGYVRASYTYTTSTTDPDNDRIGYVFDWGDGEFTWTGAIYDSGAVASASHTWWSGGSYDIRVFAYDDNGLFSAYSESVEVNIIGPNTPPNTPSQPLGPTDACIGVTKTYSTSTTDPNTDHVQYEFDWGDNTLHTITYPYPSGQQTTGSHSWSKPDTYTISVRAIDTYGATSGWSSLSVTVTQNDAGSGQDAGNDIASSLSISHGSFTGTLYYTDIYDYYYFSVNAEDIVHVSLTPSAGVNAYLDLYDTTNQHYDGRYATGGSTVDILTTASVYGNWKIGVSLSTGEGQYYFSVSADPPSPPPGPGCPYVYTWNGTRYVIDNNILPTSERSNGTDVEDYYKLEQALLPRDGQYSLLISEFEHEHSYINQVKLLAVDHDSDVMIAVDPNGQILTYKNPSAPISAVDKYGNSRLNEIRFMDGDVSNPATFFYGNASDYIVLNFGRVNSDNAKLILRDDYKSDEVCIDVQVLNRYNQWQTVATVTPRSYWSVEGVDLSRYVVRNRDFKVRLFWTSPHRLDYAGLDTAQQANYQITYATLISATHSTQGNVTTLLTANDDQYAELLPGQQILIDFTLPSNQRQARTYILYTEGHYVTIP